MRYPAQTIRTQDREHRHQKAEKRPRCGRSPAKISSLLAALRGRQKVTQQDNSLRVLEIDRHTRSGCGCGHCRRPLCCRKTLGLIEVDYEPPLLLSMLKHHARRTADHKT
jgi:hypothetical protein